MWDDELSNAEQEINLIAEAGLPSHGNQGGPDSTETQNASRARRQRRWVRRSRVDQNDITTVAHFHTRLHEFVTKGPFLYRGQSDSEWEVNCSAVRRLNTHVAGQIDNESIEPVLTGYLEYLIGRARERGLSPSDYDGLSDLEDLELLALLQHQGAATGLIDFARQPLTALWFACNGSTGKEGAVYVLPQFEVAVIKRREVVRKKLVAFYGDEKLWSWEPPVRVSRMLAQSSVFVFGAPRIPLSKMKKMRISAEGKARILYELEAHYGISEEVLFPDFPGYAVANSTSRTFAVSGAVDYWKEQVDSASDDVQKARAHFNCGVVYEAFQEYELAFSHFDQSVCLDQTFVLAYVRRGSVNIELSRFGQAIVDCDKAIILDPKAASAFSTRGCAKDELGRYEEAIADYDQAILLEPYHAYAHNDRGYVKANLNRYEEAIADYDQAIRLDPHYVYAFRNRGYAKDELGRYEEAIADYDEAIRLDPHHAYAYSDRGFVKANLNRYEEAIADYDEAIRLDPHDAVAYRHRGDAKKKTGHHEEAIADYAKSERLGQMEIMREKPSRMSTEP